MVTIVSYSTLLSYYYCPVSVIQLFSCELVNSFCLDYQGRRLNIGLVVDQGSYAFTTASPNDSIIISCILHQVDLHQRRPLLRDDRCHQQHLQRALQDLLGHSLRQVDHLHIKLAMSSFSGLDYRGSRCFSVQKRYEASL